MAKSPTNGERTLAFEYRPIPVSPMSVALLLVLGLATFVLGPLASGPELYPLGGLCFLPFAFLVLFVLVNRPSPTRIYYEGIEVSLPWWRRLVGAKRYYTWEEIENVYPASYEVSGAFLSPFASSAGTLVHTGVGLEMISGERMTVRFTPGAIRAFRGETEGFRRAMEAIRDVFRERGRPLVTRVKHYSDEEVLAMQKGARHPLLGLPTIILAFFLPPVLVAVSLLAIPLGPLASGTATSAAIVPPAIAIVITWKRSRRRNHALSEMSKFQEHLRSPR